MIEQKVIIHLKDEFSNDIGTLTVSSIDYRNDYGFIFYSELAPYEARIIKREK